jgi:acetylornithine deacetylase/succinyl-diaminopimelate desuccinylase-like protein
MFKLIRVLEKLRKHKPKIVMMKEFYDSVNSISLQNAVKFLLKRKTILPGLAKLAGKLLKTDINQFLIPLVSNSISPTNFHSGMKENSISPEAEIILDIRSLPKENRSTINQMLKKIIGKKLWSELEVSPIDDMEATSSGIDNSFYDIIKLTYSEIYPGVNLVPVLTPGSTDSKYYREHNIIAFGFSPMILDEDLTQDEFAQLPHNVDERVSVTNLNLMMDFTYRLMSRI